MKNYGNVYELKLANGKYVYICWIEECNFGVFNYYSEEPVDNLDKLLFIGLKVFKSCKETAVRKKIWKLIGKVDLVKEKIEWPDLAIYMYLDSERFIEDSRIMWNGNPLRVENDKYLKLLDKGYIYGFFDKHTIFELWLTEHIEDYPENVTW